MSKPEEITKNITVRSMHAGIWKRFARLCRQRDESQASALARILDRYVEESETCQICGNDRDACMTDLESQLQHSLASCDDESTRPSYNGGIK